MFGAIRTALEPRKIKPAEDNLLLAVVAVKGAIAAVETSPLARHYAKSYVEALLLENPLTGSPDDVRAKYLQASGRAKEIGEIHLATIAQATAAVSKAIDVLLTAKGMGDPSLRQIAGGTYVTTVLRMLAE
jgi:hypothetical protein